MKRIEIEVDDVNVELVTARGMTTGNMILTFRADEDDLFDEIEDKVDIDKIRDKFFTDYRLTEADKEELLEMIGERFVKEYFDFDEGE